MTGAISDQEARDRIRTDLATNMLVEAGAGSGKTTSLVSRMLEHVRTGTPVERLTAVTFTRKAANELRERFQNALEEVIGKAVAQGTADGEEARRFRDSLHVMDRAYIGTIHGFCARLLRERPLEIAIDPNFQETSGEEWEELTRNFWRKFVERAKRTDDAELLALYAVGIEPQELEHSFSLVMRYPDVDFPVSDTPAPDVAHCRRELARLLELAHAAMPSVEPAGGWDELMKLARRLRFSRDVEGWESVAAFCSALEAISERKCAIVQKRWSDTKEGKGAAKALSEDFQALAAGAIADVLRCWREHRYPIVMRFLQRAARDFAAQRHASGALGFEDLLLLTARLLKEHPSVRDELGARYAHLLVDEFQDTDPVQAEVCFLLASDSREGNEWRTVTPRPGSLFVVGDPKQSIYRFRRADIQVYDQVKRRLAECGSVLPLTANFRSNHAVAAVVNDYFAGVFAEESTPHQASFSPMRTLSPAGEGEGVRRYTVRYASRGKDRLLELDATLVASWIADRIAKGERKAGDFLILTPTKEPIERYARALSERNIPVSTTGAALPQEHELRELLVVLRAIADPENSVAVAAALEGLFFGMSPADLWSASQAKLRFAVTHPPAAEEHAKERGEEHPVGHAREHAVGRALMRLHEWWRTSQRHAADILLERIIDDTGLLIHAASQPLGDARAGALMHLVESLRLASVTGANGITDAMDRLELLLASEAPDAPLRPGRDDAVRVMNLHKAKGLEAPVVVLAAPVDDKEHEPEVHVTRGEGNTAIGVMRFTHRDGNSVSVLAQAPKWATHALAEQTFERAERERLRYVATTRAKQELVVAQGACVLASGDKPDSSMWRPLGGVLESATELALEEHPAAGREAMAATAESLGEAVDAAARRVVRARDESLRVTTVTERAKAPAGAEELGQGGAGLGAGLGAAWGRSVHRALEAVGRGRTGPSLRTFCVAAAREEGLSPEQGERLARMMEGMEGPGELARMRAIGELRSELTVMGCERRDGVTEVTEGVIDAALLTADGWQVLDWKTDDVDEGEWRRRKEKYDRQVARYAEMLAGISGAQAVGELRRLAGDG